MNFSRIHPDPYLDDQAPLALDRQRVVHSAAFRRLQYKTQVFVAPPGDHFRSRLTHTLEVAMLARRIAVRLNLDPDLAEVVALAHDLGHPPFGHAGERALNECLRRHGLSFEHNAHTLRVVTELEHPYPEFRGFNLTAVVLDCLRSHHTEYDHPEGADPATAPPEGRAAALADEIAYLSHDLQDGLYAGLLEPEQLQTLALWRDCSPATHTLSRDETLRRLRPTIECIQARLIEDLARTANLRLSPELQQRIDAMKKLLRDHVYRQERVVQMDEQAGRVLHAVFDGYVAEPALMPERFRCRVDRDGTPRVAADFIAGMTDRFCREQYTRLHESR